MVMTYMLGLIAARTFKSEEIITIYTCIDIGAIAGETDEYTGYYTMESMERRTKGNTGRHVMGIDGRLIDGYMGFAGAQYINSAYRAPPGWCHNARMRDGGTIAVLKGKTIRAGDEILMSYHAGYWARWGQSLHKDNDDVHAAARLDVGAPAVADDAVRESAMVADDDVEMEDATPSGTVLPGSSGRHAELSSECRLVAPVANRRDKRKRNIDQVPSARRINSQKFQWTDV